MKYKKIEVDERINFIQKTEKYGIAYFDFCFKIDKKGKIEKVFISPSQQIDKKHGWVIKCGYSMGFFIKGPDYPYKEEWGNIKGFYCKYHKSISICVSTPKNTSKLYCDHIGQDVWFKFER